MRKVSVREHFSSWQKRREIPPPTAKKATVVDERAHSELNSFKIKLTQSWTLALFNSHDRLVSWHQDWSPASNSTDYSQVFASWWLQNNRKQIKGRIQHINISAWNRNSLKQKKNPIFLFLPLYFDCCNISKLHIFAQWWRNLSSLLRQLHFSWTLRKYTLHTLGCTKLWSTSHRLCYLFRAKTREWSKTSLNKIDP